MNFQRTSLINLHGKRARARADGNDARVNFVINVQSDSQKKPPSKRKENVTNHPKVTRQFRAACSGFVQVAAAPETHKKKTFVKKTFGRLYFLQQVRVCFGNLSLFPVMLLTKILNTFPLIRNCGKKRINNSFLC